MKRKLICVVSILMIFTIIASLLPTQYVKASEMEIESQFGYLYINESTQEIGSEQSIVLSWGDGTQEISSIVLSIEDAKGNEYSLEPVRCEEGIYLYQKIFEQGTYHVTKIKVITPTAEKEFTAEELEVSAYFGVGEECGDNKKSEYIEMESADIQEVETSVVTIDENGITTAENSIADAISESDVASRNARAVSRASSGEVVVVLDPGHDSTHTGARGNGVKEETANLKIAQYCKAELEQYDGVTVYLTRTGSSCPFPDSSDNIADIKKRVTWAKSKGANIFVSIHLNASTSSTAKGAEVYYSKSNSDGKELSQKIQNELVQIGLYDRKIKTNDAYAVIKTSNSCGFPGIIVEHAFLSNSSDADKYLKTDAGLKKLGIADATGIVKYFGLKKVGEKTSVAERAYEFSNKSIADAIPGVIESSVEDNAAIIMTAKEEIASQRFEVISVGDNYYNIIAEHSGKAVTVNTTEGTVFQKELASNSKNQKFAFLVAGDGYYYLRSASGKYLEASIDEEGNSSVIASEYKGTDEQKWKFSQAKYREIEGLTPKLVSAKTSNNSVVVKWKVLTGAEGYYVYRRASGGNWKKIKTITSSTTVSYTDKNPITGKKNIYTVKAYKGNTVSKYDKTGVSVNVSKYIKYKTKTSVNYRTGPGTKYKKIGTLKKGTTVYVVKGWSKTANGLKWSKIYRNGKYYYVASKYLQKL